MVTSALAWLVLYQPWLLEVNQLCNMTYIVLDSYQIWVRYSYADIVRRILAQVEKCDRPLKEVLEDIKVTKDQWSRKARVGPTGEGGIKTSFTLAEISRIADYFRAPSGWPWVDWDLASANERALEVLARGHDTRPTEALTPTKASPSARPGRRRAGGGKL